MTDEMTQQNSTSKFAILFEFKKIFLIINLYNLSGSIWWDEGYTFVDKRTTENYLIGKVSWLSIINIPKDSLPKNLTVFLVKVRWGNVYLLLN